MSRTAEAYERNVEPRAVDWRHQAWAGGAFDSGRRSYTECVEGRIRTPQHIVIVTLAGGARRVEASTDCGHRYSGADWRGAVSFVPAHCCRRLVMSGVDAEWGSISLDPSFFSRPRSRDNVELSAFSNAEDAFVAAVVGEFASLHRRDGQLDPVYCQVMGAALSEHLLCKFGQARHQDSERATWKIAPWRLRRVLDHIEANLDSAIRIDELAALAGLSTGYFHRASGPP